MSLTQNFATALKRQSVSALSLLAGGAAVLALSAPAAFAAAESTPPSIINLAAGTPVSGGFLWSYQVSGGSKPALSHWVLSLCDNALGSLVNGSVVGSSKVEFGNDPTTGAYGIKFDTGFNDNEVRTVSFKLSQNFVTVQGDATFKSGNTTPVVLSVAAPGCTTVGNTIPEPATAALLLMGAAPLAGGLMVRRRRAARG